MAELTISPDEIRSALDEFVSSYQRARRGSALGHGE